MAIEQSSHLILLEHRIKGWSLYKSTVKKGGDLVTRTYKGQLVQAGKVVNAQVKVTTSMVNGHKKIKKSLTTTAIAAKKTGHATNDLVKALKRAAIVAPVWLALRSIMMGTLRTISEGAKYWEEFDKAIQKSKQVIHNATGTMSDAIAELTSNITDLSIETGLSMAKLSSTFYRFGTVGLDFSKSMEGMETATKIANIMFGDSDEIARVLAQTYKLLGESMDSTIPSAQRMEVIGSVIYKLWKTNAFEIGEFSQALQRFLPTANSFNFSVNETSALLATLQSAGLKSSKAGRLLSTSILKMIPNLNKMALTLGIHVNPELDTTFTVLRRVLGALKDMAGVEGIPVEALKALELFGGVRQRQAPMALVALYKELEKNISMVNTEQSNLNVLLGDMNKANDEVLKTTHKQLERFRNLKTMIGQSFVQWITGADSYKDSLDTINVAMENAVHPIKAVRDAWINAGKSVEDYEKKIELMRTAKHVLPRLGRYTGDPHTAVPSEAPTQKPRKQIDRTMEYELGLLKDQYTYIQMQNKGLSKSTIAHKKLEKFLKAKVKLYNTTGKVLSGEVETIKEQEVISLALKGSYEELLNLSKGIAISKEDILQIEKMNQTISKEREQLQQKVFQTLVSHEINLLKMRGANNRQIIESTMAMNEQLGIKQDSLSLLKNQLALEQEITKEKLGQTKISSESVKLYEISQKYSVRTAESIAKWLSGQTKFKDMYKKTVKIAEEFFKTEVQADKAREFFKGYFGKGIMTKEKLAEKAMSPRVQVEMVDGVIKSKEITRALDIQKRAEEVLPSIADIKLPGITTNIQKIEINVKTALKEALGDGKLSQNILDDLAKAIKTNPKIKESIEEVIEGY